MNLWLMAHYPCRDVDSGRLLRDLAAIGETSTHNNLQT